MSHQKAKQELDKLAECFDNTVIQAGIFQEALGKVTNADEAAQLIIDMGKVLDNHHEKMAAL